MTPPPVRDVAGLLALYVELGDDPYGEDVSQLDHALQCAQLARRDGADDHLVAAALLHDVGHLVAGPRPTGWRDEVDDDRHEAAGARLLGRLFGVRVAAPVALHVCAKRWLAATEPGYLAALSATSLASLAAQGGPLDEAGRARFEAHRAFGDAVRLRRFDDAAKDPRAAAAPLSSYEPMLRSLARHEAPADGTPRMATLA